MARILASGVALHFPIRSPDEIVQIERELKNKFRIRGHWSNSARQEIFMRLGFAVGRHHQQAERPTNKQVAMRVRGVVKAVDHIQEILGREAGGFMTMDPVANEAWFRLMNYLGLNPLIGTREKAGLVALDWCRNLEDLRHACELVLLELKEIKGEQHRDTLVAYDDFVKALLFAASKLRIRPTVSEDRIKGQPTGPFYRLAELMEQFLPGELKSPSHSARRKRLERSQARLLGQKPKN